MIAASHDQQHRGTDAACGGHAIAAMRRLASAHQFQSPPSRAADLPHARNLARGLTRPERFLFTPRTIVLDEIAELRLCRLNRRQPVLQSAQAPCIEARLFQPVAEPLHVDRLSNVAVAMTNHDRKGVGSAQESVGVFQNVDC